MNRIVLSILTILVFGQFAFSLNLDSLRNVWNNQQLHDTERLDALGKLSWFGYIFSDPDSARILSSIELKYAKKKGLEKFQAQAMNAIGGSYYLQGNYDSALVYYLSTKRIQKELKDSAQIAKALNNIGLIYRELGQFEQAIEAHFEGLRIKELINDGPSIPYSLCNIAMLYEDQEEIDDAINYYQRSYEQFKLYEDQKGMLNAINGMAIIRLQKNDTLGLRQQLIEGVEISRSINDIQHLSLCLNNLARFYRQTGKVQMSLIVYNEALNLRKELEDKLGIAITLNNMAMSYLQLEDPEMALKYSKEALKTAQEIQNTGELSNSYSTLYMIYKRLENSKLALESYENHILFRDSIINESNQKEAIRKQTKYEFEKEQLLREQKLKEESLKLKEATDRRNSLQYSVIFISILILLTFVFSLGKLKVSPFVAEGLIFFVFLIFFEFMLVLGDPYIEDITGGEPIYKLLANAVLAGVIFPAHAIFERALKNRIVK